MSPSDDSRPSVRGARLGPTARDGHRAQTAVVGVALLLALTVVAVGGLTATAGSIVDDGATTAATTRVGSDLATALGPDPEVETTIGVTGGTIRVVNRSVWLLDSDGVVWAGHAGAVVYADGDHRVTGFAGAVVRTDGDRGRMVAPSRISPTEDGLYVGVPVLNATGADGIATGDRRLSVTLRTDAETARETLPAGEYRIAVETPIPAAWERHFAERGAETTRRDVDGDGVPSVVASWSGARRVHLVVHDVRLRVGVGG